MNVLCDTDNRYVNVTHCLCFAGTAFVEVVESVQGTPLVLCCLPEK